MPKLLHLKCLLFANIHAVIHCSYGILFLIIMTFHTYMSLYFVFAPLTHTLLLSPFFPSFWSPTFRKIVLSSALMVHMFYSCVYSSTILLALLSPLTTSFCFHVLHKHINWTLHFAWEKIWICLLNVAYISWHNDLQSHPFSYKCNDFVVLAAK